MKRSSSRRKFSNIKLTEKYHFRYLGTFMIVVIFFVILANVALYLFFEEHHRYVRASVSASDRYALLGSVPAVRKILLALLVAEAVVTIGGIVFLAKLTAHRIAGVFIRMRDVFDEVRAGDLRQRLKFRSCDHLDDLETAFNAMMDEIERKMGETPAKSGDPAEDAEGPADGEPVQSQQRE